MDSRSSPPKPDAHDILVRARLYIRRHLHRRFPDGHVHIFAVLHVELLRQRRRDARVVVPANLAHRIRQFQQERIDHRRTIAVYHGRLRHERQALRLRRRADRFHQRGIDVRRRQSPVARLRANRVQHARLHQRHPECFKRRRREGRLRVNLITPRLANVVIPCDVVGLQRLRIQLQRVRRPLILHQPLDVRLRRHPAEHRAARRHHERHQRFLPGARRERRIGARFAENRVNRGLLHAVHARLRFRIAPALKAMHCGNRNVRQRRRLVHHQVQRNHQLHLRQRLRKTHALWKGVGGIHSVENQHLHRARIHVRHQLLHRRRAAQRLLRRRHDRVDRVLVISQHRIHQDAQQMQVLCIRRVRRSALCIDNAPRRRIHQRLRNALVLLQRDARLLRKRLRINSAQQLFRVRVLHHRVRRRRSLQLLVHQRRDHKPRAEQVRRTHRMTIIGIDARQRRHRLERIDARHSAFRVRRPLRGPVTLDFRLRHMLPQRIAAQVQHHVRILEAVTRCHRLAEHRIVKLALLARLQRIIHHVLRIRRNRQEILDQPLVRRARNRRRQQHHPTPRRRDGRANLFVKLRHLREAVRRRLHEVPLALRAHGALQPVGIVKVQHTRLPPRAQGPAVHRVIGIPLKLDRAPLARLHQKAARRRALAAR